MRSILLYGVLYIVLLYGDVTLLFYRMVTNTSQCAGLWLTLCLGRGCYGRISATKMTPRRLTAPELFLTPRLHVRSCCFGDGRFLAHCLTRAIVSRSTFSLPRETFLDVVTLTQTRILLVVLYREFYPDFKIHGKNGTRAYVTRVRSI